MQCIGCLPMEYTHSDNFISSHCGRPTSLLLWRSSSCSCSTPTSWGRTVSWFPDALNTLSFSRSTKTLHNKAAQGHTLTHQDMHKHHTTLSYHRHTDPQTQKFGLAARLRFSRPEINLHLRALSRTPPICHTHYPHCHTHHPHYHTHHPAHLSGKASSMLSLTSSLSRLTMLHRPSGIEVRAFLWEWELEWEWEWELDVNTAQQTAVKRAEIYLIWCDCEERVNHQSLLTTDYFTLS